MGKLEQSRIILSEREKQMLESKEQKDNELQMAKTLSEEAHQRLFTGKLNQG